MISYEEDHQERMYKKIRNDCMSSLVIDEIWNLRHQNGYFVIQVNFNIILIDMQKNIWHKKWDAKCYQFFFQSSPSSP